MSCPPVLGVTGDTEALRLAFARKREGRMRR